MARRSKRPASRGSVNNMILKALSAGDKYGYEIIKEVEEESEGKIVLKQPSLYSSLSRFETKGFVSSYWEDSEIGGRRHYYSLTPEGKEYYTKFVLKEDSNEVEDTDIEEDSAETFIEDSNIEENIQEDEQEDNESFEVYNYDQNIEDEKIEHSFTKYNFNVQDKIAELLNDEEIDNENNAEFVEEFASKMEGTQEEEDEYYDGTEEYSTSQEPEEYEEESQEDLIQNNDNEVDDSVEVEDSAYEEVVIKEVVPEAKSAREQLKEIYNSIVTSKKPQKKPQQPLSNHTPTPEEIQRRKESMKILYGPSTSQNSNNQVFNSPTSKTAEAEANKKERLFQSSDYQELVKTSNQIAKNNSIITKEVKNPVEQPKKRFVVDEFGIMKIAEDIPEKKQKVFDNVGYRTSNTGHNVTEYKPPIQKTAQPKQVSKIESFKEPVQKYSEIELTPEERTARQERFNERFENLQKERMGQRDIQPESLITQSNDEPVYDGRPPSTFKNKNVKLFRDLPKTEQEPEEDPFVENLAFNEVTVQEELQDIRTNAIRTEFDNNDNSILELQKELINKGVEFKSYSKESTIRKDRDFVLHNKLKFALGFIMLFLMAIEVTAFLFVSQNLGFYIPDNKPLFIGAYAIVGFVSICLIAPFIFAPHKRKINNFRFGYNLLFGLFAFILTAILSYALNTLAGLTMDTINYYMTSLLLPMVLAVNFILVPLIYNILLKTKAFY